MDTVKIYGLVPDSIVDGPGLRYSIFVQGCTHHCPGCHNPESQSEDGGSVISIDEIVADITSNKLISGVTFSGGEPFEQPEACASLAKRLKADGYGIWAYTGYLYDDLLRMAQEDPSIGEFLDHIDVLVDGPFIESLRSIDLEWRGSQNQRLIDMAQTRNTGSVVLLQTEAPVFAKPANW